MQIKYKIPKVRPLLVEMLLIVIHIYIYIYVYMSYISSTYTRFKSKITTTKQIRQVFRTWDLNQVARICSKKLRV